MRYINLGVEWEFIQNEIINANKNNLSCAERGILFTLQISLLKENIAMYKDLKSIYIHKTKASMN
jgi:hypothetical protein